MGTIVGLVVDKVIDGAPLDEGPFACPYCDKEYKKKEYLYKHIESKHVDKVVVNTPEGEG